MTELQGHDPIDSETPGPAPDVKLSVVIPVFNEKELLPELLRRVLAVPIPKEIVLVDDSSTDGTRDWIRGLEARVADRGPGAIGAVLGTEPSAPVEVRFHFHPANRGKGAAVREGIARTTGDVLLVQDADLEYDPADYPALVAPILEGRADVVYGSRLRGGGLRDGYLGNYLANRFFTFVSNLFTGLRLSDVETCYKVMRGDLARSLRLESDRFGFDPEITARIARTGCRVVEVPVRYSGRTYAEGKKIRWRDGLVVLAAIVRHGLRR